MSHHSSQIRLDAYESDSHSLEDYDWTFSKANTTYLTHGLHKYPARMPPQLPASLLSHYRATDEISTGDLVYDPFSGSGTTSVEAVLGGFDVVANDINPFAVHLSRAKAIPLDIETLDEAFLEFENNLQEIFDRVAMGEVEIPDHLQELGETIGNEWFPSPQLEQLLIARNRLDQLESSYPTAVIRFLRIGLSRGAREVSYQRAGEFKRYRLSEEDRETHSPDAFSKLHTALQDNRRRMRDYVESVNRIGNTIIGQADSRNSIENEALGLSENCADIVITSPPYGDHRTTVAYGEFSTNLSSLAFGDDYEDMADVDEQGLGGASVERSLDTVREYSDSLDQVLDRLDEKEGRSKDALEFFSDYYSVIQNVGKVVKPGQPTAWVVACRRMSDELIPTHKITKEFCESLGYSEEAVLPREIIRKTLPNSNPAGETMTDEFIVVMRGPE